MNRIIYSLIFLCFAIQTVSGQNTQPLLTIDKTEVSLEEFERIYKKNNSNLFSESEKKSPKEYLELFVNFKLKVIEAQNLKMDTNSTFINELAGYRKELAEPYLTDVKFKQELVEKMYERMSKEVNASHILFELGSNATADDEKLAFEKALTVKNEILAGKDFSAAAFEYSDDPSAKTNNGNLGYFSAFQMVVPFEDAAFSIPAGTISEPVRSAFGYHLIKVHDIRENQGEIKVAHIMKMFPQGGVTNEFKSSLKREIDSVYAQLLEGADFAELAKNLSDDKSTGENGGEMPWFSSGRMIPEFSEPAFAIKNIGDFTPPIETPYGFHIIKKLDQHSISSFDELKEDIESRIVRDPARSTYSKKAFIDKLKQEYNYLENSENVNILRNSADINEPSMYLFTVDNIKYDLKSFNLFLENSDTQNTNFSENFNSWVEHELTNLEDSKLEEKYPEFNYLMQEYYDGILLFNISEDKIWNYASEDSAGLEKYYRKNKGKYLWEERFKGYVVICNGTEVREKAEMYFASDMFGEEIEDLLNKDEKQITIQEGAWEKGSNAIVDYFVWDGPEPQYFVGEHTFIRGDKIPPEPKILDEARGLYISEYQNYLEKNWIKELRRKYKIKVNKKLLKSISDV